MAGNTTFDKQRRSDRLRVKTVAFELRALLPLMEASMDDTTRLDVEMTLRNCVARLSSVAKHLSGKTKTRSVS